jgi:hypothetical protein
MKINEIQFDTIESLLESFKADDPKESEGFNGNQYLAILNVNNERFRLFYDFRVHTKTDETAIHVGWSRWDGVKWTQNRLDTNGNPVKLKTGLGRIYGNIKTLLFRLITQHNATIVMFGRKTTVDSYGDREDQYNFNLNFLAKQLGWDEYDPIAHNNGECLVIQHPKSKVSAAEITRIVTLFGNAHVNE